MCCEKHESPQGEEDGTEGVEIEEPPSEDVLSVTDGEGALIVSTSFSWIIAACLATEADSNISSDGISVGGLVAVSASS